jgi:hypothetical protein
MRKAWTLSLPALLAIVMAASASPAQAQTRHPEHKRSDEVHRHDDRRPQLRRRDDHDRHHDRDRAKRHDRRDHSRWDTWSRRRNVPPGWCQGRGNPHNTVENCGYGPGRYDPRAQSGRYERGTYDPYGVYGRNQEERDRQLDRQCRAREAERPGDPIWQLQVAKQCRLEQQRERQRR